MVVGFCQPELSRLSEISARGSLNQMREKLAVSLNGFGAGGCLSRQHHVRLAFDCRLDALPEESVIVDAEDSVLVEDVKISDRA